MKLRKIFNDDSLVDINISNIMYDYRQKIDNSIFFCLVDLDFDGHNVINVAIENGAKVIVHSRQLKSFRDGIIYIFIHDLGEKFLIYVHRFYDDVTRKIIPIGVLGSFGKGVVSDFIYQLISLDQDVILFNDNQIICSNKKYKIKNLNHLSSNYIIIYWLFLCNYYFNLGIKNFIFNFDDKLVRFNLLKGFVFKSLLLTNYLVDEFNYQLNLEDSFIPYQQLFLNLENNVPIIINLDDRFSEQLVNKLVNPILSISYKNDASIKVTHTKFNLNGTEYSFMLNNQNYSYSINLLGKSNLSYLLLALLNSLVLGYSLDYVLENMSSFKFNNLGLNKIDNPFNIDVIIDNSDSLISLEYVLSFLSSKLTKKQRLILVFIYSNDNKISLDFELGELLDKYCDIILMNNCETFIKEKRLTTGITTHPYVIIDDVNELLMQSCLIAHDGDVILLLHTNQKQSKLNKDLGENINICLKEIFYEVKSND